MLTRDAPSFDVHLDVFTGPFDLLLGLIAKHRLDITEVALAEVTDEFIAHVRRLRTQPPEGPAGDAAGDPLGQLSGFLLVAATLLDLKAARLLPAGEVEDVEDLALLEARDLLFARLLQHRAYSRVAALMAQVMGEQARHAPRAVPLEEHLVAALPALIWTTTARQLADLAAAALAPKPAQSPQVATDHLHAPSVSVPEQVGLLAALLRAAGSARFADLVADAAGPAVVVGRFLAVLEMYRRGWVDLAQDVPLGPLDVSWAGPDEAPDEAPDDAAVGAGQGQHG